MEKTQIERTKTIKYKISKLISRIFDVPVAALVLLYLIWKNTPPGSSISRGYLIFGAFYLIIIPIILVILLIRVKVVDNWELTNKDSRKYVYGLGFMTLATMVILALFFNIPEYFTDFLILGLVFISVFGLITHFTKYKLSIHISIWTALIAYLAAVYNPGYLFLSPILVLIGYARFTIKNHTFMDMALAFLTVIIIVIGFFTFSDV